MGSYFEDVYLKRINKDGETRQDRVKTRKEREFDNLFLQRTEYRALIYQINDEPAAVVCSLQPNNWNESKLISNLLVSTKAPKFKTGDLLYIRQTIKKVESDKLWLVLFVENNLTEGYQLFKLICLDSEINFTDEYGITEMVVPAKFVNATANLIQDTFVHSATQLGYREPRETRFFITQDSDFFERAQYFEYKGKGWEIAGIDNISIEGVAYVSITARLIREAEPIASKDLLVGEDDNFFLNGGV